MAKQKWITLDNGTHVPLIEGKSIAESIDAFVYRNRAKMFPFHLDYDHYSRLKVLFSQYHLGTYQAKVLQNVKLFDLDTTFYIVAGEYPDFKVIGKKTYKSVKKIVQIWEENNEQFK